MHTRPDPSKTEPPLAPRPRWFEALLAWYLGWLGKVFTGKL